MKHWPMALMALLAMTLASAAGREPSIGYVYPAGGRQGTTFTVVVGGSNLQGVSAAWVSGVGVSCVPLAEDRQVTPAEQTALRGRVDALHAKLRQGVRLTPAELTELDEASRRLVAYGRALANPALGEFITLRVTVAADAPIGPRELRLLANAGLTNPRAFDIGDLPEDTRPEWRNLPRARETTDAAIPAAPPPVAVTLPATLNGQVVPGGVVRYRFAARAGQQLVASIGARRFNPYIADAVPGWLQALATLTSADGHELARSSVVGSLADAVLLHRVAADGELELTVRDALYRGREDFVYRIRLGERLAITPDEPAANPVSTGLDPLPELAATPASGQPAGQPVSLPAVVTGSLAAPDATATFRLAGTAGQRLVAEVTARRLGSPLDSVLRLFDPAGQLVAMNDDQPDLASALNTHHADSYLSLALPVGGEYRLTLSDAQAGGGPDHVYRLRLSAPRPDFELRLTPASVTLRPGACAAVTAYAVRRDGFDGEIRLALADAPAGFWLAGATIAAGADRARFTIGAPPQAFAEPVALGLTGQAQLGGQTVTRPVVPAVDRMQAFSYHHLVPALELRAAVIGRFRPGAMMRVQAPSPLRLTPGRRQTVQVAVPAGPGLASISYELSEPPSGIRLVTLAPGSLAIEADATAKVGQRGNLIIEVWGQPATAPGEPTPPADRQRVPLGCLPALAYEVGG